ncbi:uncharacterized protein LOC144869578 [Branchiostoma floridae x Branchiostoma japonicum]
MQLVTAVRFETRFESQLPLPLAATGPRTAEPLFPNRLSCHADDRGLPPGNTYDSLCPVPLFPARTEDGRCLDYAMERTVLETCRRYCGVLPEHLPSPMIVHYHKDAEEGAPDDDSTVNTIRTYRGLENGLSY